MAYVATKGGEHAIQESEKLFHELKGTINRDVVQNILDTMPYLVDRVMGEGSLYAPELAALAIAQAGGDVYEAVLLMRAYRSTQPRVVYAKPLSVDDMLTVRRISAAFKDIPGGQILGPSLDYSHRILDLSLLDKESSEQESVEPAENPAPTTYPLVADWLRKQELIKEVEVAEDIDPADIPDVTRDPVAIPAPRAHRLQSLSRADTGGLLALGYASMRGYGFIHPTVNELRLAKAEVEIKHPVTGESFSIGRMRVSQAEVITKGKSGYSLGFTATMGWNETKLIAGATLDMEMNHTSSHPALSEDFVMYHTEPIESHGFCNHFKLPHYVTFASSMDNMRKVIKTLYGAKAAGIREDEAEEDDVQAEQTVAKDTF